MEELMNTDGPVLINCIVEKEENVFPMIPSGTSVDHMVGKKGEI